MTEYRIRDIPSIQKVLRDAQHMGLAAKVFPWIRPLLRMVGVRTEGVAEALSRAPDLIRIAEELSVIPDRFNEFFSKRGWVIYESLSVDVAKAALEAAESGRLERADQILVEYYNEETINFALRRLSSLESFRPRLVLAQKALKDYVEARYHACVPVVLALLDGFVNDLGDCGFFAKQADVTAWDSIAGHDKGLQQLARIFQKARLKTRTDPITVPYRHGIMHGRDLGYDNELVAAKAWAALIATGDWAYKVERGQKDKPPESRPKQPTIAELAQRLRDNAAESARIQAWTPRSIKVGTDVARTVGTDEYTERSPERSLVEFLHLWQARNYGHMVSHLPAHDHRDGTATKLAGEIRGIYASRRLADFELREVKDIAPSVTEITIGYSKAEAGETTGLEPLTFRLIHEDPDGMAVTRGNERGSWKIVNWCLS